MSPSILQLQSLGLQDVYLTKDPQINIFKYTYYRYVNFATDIAKLPLNDSAAFNKRMTCNIPKKGHLLSKMYLHLQLPKLQKRSGEYACWTDTLGYAIFSDPIELEIGGVIVDRIYPQFMDIWEEFKTGNTDFGKNLMVLRSDVPSATKENASRVTDLMIPLDFWFTKHYSSALPILSMFSQDIKIHFKLRDFSMVINYDGLQPYSVPIIESNVYAEYIFLDDVILKQFKDQKHMYIMEQVQFHETEFINTGTTNFNTSIKFNHPVKELIFCLADVNSIENNNYFYYSNSTNNNPLLKEAALLLDGKRRFDYLPEFYFRCMFPQATHKYVPLRHIYSIPFSIRPEDNQPTGSLNMSRFNDITLSLKMPQNNPDCFLYVYALSYNVLIIENGVLSIEFAT
uniref:Major capsid protein N-terminal domain-containing protein n=1 Tax=viral metagenome TaxID=1070528 RepID=A0A6C0E1N1_9ZZZZ